MAIAKELQDLDKGDQIEGGVMMEGLSDETIVWLVERPYDPVSRNMIVSAAWLGVPLGRFMVSDKGTERAA